MKNIPLLQILIELPAFLLIRRFAFHSESREQPACLRVGAFSAHDLIE
jgi:hypothetical protein